MVARRGGRGSLSLIGSYMGVRLEDFMHDAHPLRIALPGRGGTVEALELGPAGRPYDVVFSHANGFNALTYRTILAPLAADLRILAYDLRGHGASTLPAVSAGRTG